MSSPHTVETAEVITAQPTRRRRRKRRLISRVRLQIAELTWKIVLAYVVAFGIALWIGLRI